MLFVQHCKEEEMSDDGFIESSCDEENEDNILYTSERFVEEWQQMKEKIIESKEQWKQGHSKTQLLYHPSSKEDFTYTLLFVEQEMWIYG